MAKKAALILRGFKELAGMLDPSKFEARLKKEVEQATKKNALLAEGAIKRGITEGKGIAPNSPFTIALKGSSRPLVDSGELLKSVIGRAESWDAVIVGVLKSRAVRDPDTGRTRDLLSVAQILHSGATVKVTDKMRRFFFYMASQYEKGVIKQPWKPLSARTKAIRIPPRPFLKFAVTAGMTRKYQDNWGEAVQRAMAGGK